MPNVRQVHSNLMRAAGLDLHIQECEVLIAPGDFEDCMSRPAGASSQHGHSRAVVPAASDPRFDVISLFGHPAINQRDVPLEDLPVTKLIRQSLVRKIVL